MESSKIYKGERCKMCGSSQIRIVEYLKHGRQRFFVTCKTCKCRTGIYKNEQKAIDRWEWRQECLSK